GGPVEAETPRGEVRDVGVGSDEDAVVDVAVGLPVGPLDPPGRVARELDPRLALDRAHLPRRRRAVLRGLEVLRQAEVALAARGELDVLPDPQHLERA